MGWTLVTGGAKGLGAEICRTLAKKGFSILLHYRTSDREATEVIQECRSLGAKAEKIQGDFSTTDSTKKFIQEVRQKRVSNLINNIGNYLMTSALETTEGEWHHIFQSNLHVPFLLIHSLIDQIKEARGNVVNLGIAGMQAIRADTHSTAYTAAKLALWSLTKSLAKELAGSFVRVNMVSPGYLENSVDLPSSYPMSRAGTLQEVARVIAFLLDEQSRYITGQNIEVAGGVRL